MNNKNILQKLNFIEIYQIFGGVIGLILTFYMMFIDSFNFLNFASFIEIFMPFLYFGICIYSGILINKKKYKLGFNLVFITLFLQIISITISDFHYDIINGFGLKITLNLTTDFILGLEFNFSKFLVLINNISNKFEVKINLIAIVMLIYCLKIYDYLKISKKII